MKKILALIIAVMMTVALAGCSGGKMQTSSAIDPKPPVKESEEPSVSSSDIESSDVVPTFIPGVVVPVDVDTTIKYHDITLSVSSEWTSYATDSALYYYIMDENDSEPAAFVMVTIVEDGCSSLTEEYADSYFSTFGTGMGNATMLGDYRECTIAGKTGYRVQYTGTQNSERDWIDAAIMEHNGDLYSFVYIDFSGNKNMGSEYLGYLDAILPSVKIGGNAPTININTGVQLDADKSFNGLSYKVSSKWQESNNGSSMIYYIKDSAGIPNAFVMVIVTEDGCPTLNSAYADAYFESFGKGMGDAKILGNYSSVTVAGKSGYRVQYHGTQNSACDWIDTVIFENNGDLYSVVYLDFSGKTENESMFMSYIDAMIPTFNF